MSPCLSRPLAHSQAAALLPYQASFSDYLHDESKLSAEGCASITFPQTSAELIGCWSRAIASGESITLSGARTGLVGGAVPEYSGHVISFEKLRGVLSLDRSGEGSLTVLPGTSLREIQDYLAEHAPEYILPVDTTERSASIGGMVSTDAGGARSYFYGKTRAWVSALEVLLPIGESIHVRRQQDRLANHSLILQSQTSTREFTTIEIPKPSTKSSIGYSWTPNMDLVDLFVGAEGTLGAVSEITLRLAKKIPNILFHMQFFSTEEEALDFVNTVRNTHALTLLSLEFLDSRSLQLVAAHPRQEFQRISRAAEGARAAVLVEFLGDAGEIAEALDSILGEALASSVSGTDDSFIREAKLFRHAVPETINSIISKRRSEHPVLHKLATDMSVQDADLHWVFALYRDTLRDAGLDFAIFGHVGNNHFHVNILPKTPEELLRAKTIYLGFASQVAQRGGAVSAEHGIGRLKREFLKVQYGAEVLASMRRIKSFFDPDWRVNRDVLLKHIA